MSLNYTREQFWKMYNRLPQELKEAIFSENLTNNVYDICERNKIEEVPELTKYAQYVLLGGLPPDEFQKTIKEEMGLEKETAEKTAKEVYRFILHPVKNSLEALYEIEIATPATSTREEPQSQAEKVKEKPKDHHPPKKDPYRETLEEK
ncbi:MAG: hypothetical protein GF370_04620 [Candidatus Nealsonbacteria bacterium]|nr:hypothetical protein [Candidatus Nealsonbacteria bacterium]